MKKTFYLLAGIAIGAIFLYFSVKDLEAPHFIYIMEHLKPLWILPMIAFCGLFFIFKAVRWKLLLKPIHTADMKTLFSSVMAGASVGYLITMYLGEIVRTLSFAKQTNVSKSSILATIFLERVFDLIILLLFFGIAIFFTQDLPFDARKIGLTFTIISLTLFAWMLFAVFKTEKCLKIAHVCLRWLPQEIQKKIVHQIDQGILGLHSLKNPSLLAGIILTSFISWFFMVLSNYSAILVVGIEAPFYSAFLIMGLVIAALSLPNPPGNVGVVEWCYVMGLSPYGIDPSAAFAAAIVFHLIIYPAVIFCGFLFYRNKQRLLDP